MLFYRLIDKRYILQRVYHTSRDNFFEKVIHVVIYFLKSHAASLLLNSKSSEDGITENLQNGHLLSKSIEGYFLSNFANRILERGFDHHLVPNFLLDFILYELGDLLSIFILLPFLDLLIVEGLVYPLSWASITIHCIQGVNEKPDKDFHMILISYDQINVSILHLNCDTLPWEECKVGVFLQVSRVHWQDVLPVDPEPWGNASVDESCDVRDLAAALGLHIFVVAVQSVGLFCLYLSLDFWNIRCHYHLWTILVNLRLYWFSAELIWLGAVKAQIRLFVGEVDRFDMWACNLLLCLILFLEPLDFIMVWLYNMDDFTDHCFIKYHELIWILGQL